MAVPGRSAYVAFDSLSRARSDLHAPTGSFTDDGPLCALADQTFGARKSTEASRSASMTFRTETAAELEQVDEELIGAAFALAQSFIVTYPEPWTATQEQIHAVANYWKHRGQWGPTWADAHQGTRKVIKALGARPPTKPGQLRELAETVLGAPFDVMVLWTAIT